MSQGHFTLQLRLLYIECIHEFTKTVILMHEWNLNILYLEYILLHEHNMTLGQQIHNFISQTASLMDKIANQKLTYYFIPNAQNDKLNEY